MMISTKNNADTRQLFEFYFSCNMHIPKNSKELKMILKFILKTLFNFSHYLHKQQILGNDNKQ